ncbi:hypothetical protein, partial [Microcoleus sp. PH2017_32_RDM_D_A]|uniref:hypothetical protein n=1 Tax=Microcoleus sp. PH2017_32_RDM_D_A TaxID=2798842 RepID=UPI0025DACD41
RSPESRYDRLIIGMIESMTWRSTDSFKIQGAGSPTIFVSNPQSHKPAPTQRKIPIYPRFC